MVCWWGWVTSAATLARCLATAVSAVCWDFAGRLQEILSCLFRTAAREIAVAAVKLPPWTAVGAASPAWVVCFVWVSRVEHKLDILVQATVGGSLFGTPAAAGRFPFRVMFVGSLKRKVVAARTDSRRSCRTRTARAVAHIPRSVESVRSRRTAGWVGSCSRFGTVAAGSCFGRTRAPGMAAAAVGLHCRIWNFFVQPLVVYFAAARSRRCGR